MRLFDPWRRPAPPPSAIDQDQIREQMTQEDPSMLWVRQVHHDAIQLVTGVDAKEQLRKRARSASELERRLIQQRRDRGKPDA